MTVLVTGGSGYFGSTLVDLLLKSDHDVRIFDLNPPDPHSKTVDFVQGDIRDKKAVEKACHDVTTVYHNIAQVPLAKDKHLFTSVNIGGIQTLLDTCIAYKVKKIIYTSSSAVFGVPQQNPVTEETVPLPKEAYGKAKYQAELICADYIKQGLDISIIRPRTILGHGRLGIFQILFDWISKGYNIPVLGNGHNIYQFVHAHDLAQACILAAKEGPDIFNIGTEYFSSMREALEALLTHADTGSTLRNIPMLPAIIGMKVSSQMGLSPLGDYHALMYGRSLYFDVSKAKKKLGWSSTYSNNHMFIESYDSYLKHQSTLFEHDRSKSLHQSAIKQGILSFFAKYIF